jgi:hypothetical protein
MVTNNKSDCGLTINIMERKSNCTIELVAFPILLAGALISYKYSDSPLLVIIFLVSLIVPSFGIFEYLWDIPAKIELSKDQMIIYYGRRTMDNQHIEGRFIFPLVERIKWENITGFNLKSHVHTTYSGEGNTEFTYHYLVITDRSIINLNKNPNERCKIRLNHFEKKPEEILAICKQFQSELTHSV